MYRVVYYHHAVRAASVLLSSVLRRAFELFRSDHRRVFPALPGGNDHPLAQLAEKGHFVDLHQYLRLGEHHVWALIECWQYDSDPVLSDLAQRLMGRKLFKTVDVDPMSVKKLDRLKDVARAATIRTLPHVNNSNVDYYVTVDEPTRTSYKIYDWRTSASDESIWIVGDGTPQPIEKANSETIAALRMKKYFHRMVFPPEVREEVIREVAKGK